VPDNFELGTRLYLHAGQDEVDLAASLTMKHGFATILTAPSDLRRRNREEKLLAAASQYADLTGFLPELDLNNYSGSNRRPGNADISIEWIRTQKRAGINLPQTDPGFIAADRFDHLAHVLDQSVAIQQTVGYPISAAVALDSTFLLKHAGQVADTIQTRPLHEVRLMLGHPKDPFGAQATAKGILDVLALGNVGVHRTDLSAIPVIASGGSSASIGTKTSLRHVYTGSSGGYFPSGAPSVIVPGTMAYRLQDRLNDYIARFPDDVFWNCGCDTCYLRRVDIAIRTEAQAIEHNYNIIAELAEAVVGPRGGGMPTWFSRSQQAQFRIDELVAETRLAWEAPSYLGAWLSTQRTSAGV
jgi:hypothetical protein